MMQIAPTRLAENFASEPEPQGDGEIVDRVAKLAGFRAALVMPSQLAHTNMRVTLTYAVVDVNSLPSSLVIVQPNEAEIKRLFCAGWKEGDAIPSAPGIRFEINRDPIPTGRR